MADEAPMVPASHVAAAWEPYWVVGILALFWNAFGAADFALSLTLRDSWFEFMGVAPEQAAVYESMPAWTFAPWAAGTWGAFFGSIGLLLRARWAVLMFLISMLGLILSLIYSFLLSDTAELMGDQAYGMYSIIFIAAAFFIWYSWTMKRRGILR